MFIKLTENQRREVQRYLMPENAYQPREGREIEPDEFWDLDWYLIDQDYENQPTTIEPDYPWSVQVKYQGQWYEIDAVAANWVKIILEVR